MWDTLYKYRNILQIQQFKTHKLFKRKILFKYLQLRINKFEYASSKLVLYFILFGTRSLLNTRPDRFDRFDVYKIQTDRQKNVLNFMYETNGSVLLILRSINQGSYEVTKVTFKSSIYFANFAIYFDNRKIIKCSLESLDLNPLSLYDALLHQTVILDRQMHLFITLQQSIPLPH